MAKGLGKNYFKTKRKLRKVCGIVGGSQLGRISKAVGHIMGTQPGTALSHRSPGVTCVLPAAEATAYAPGSGEPLVETPA